MASSQLDAAYADIIAKVKARESGYDLTQSLNDPAHATGAYQVARADITGDGVDELLVAVQTTSEANQVRVFLCTNPDEHAAPNIILLRGSAGMTLNPMNPVYPWLATVAGTPGVFQIDYERINGTFYASLRQVNGDAIQDTGTYYTYPPENNRPHIPDTYVKVVFQDA